MEICLLAGLDAGERDRVLLPILFCMETCTRKGINVSSISIVAAMQCKAINRRPHARYLPYSTDRKKERKKRWTALKRDGAGAEGKHES